MDNLDVKQNQNKGKDSERLHSTTQNCLVDAGSPMLLSIPTQQLIPLKHLKPEDQKAPFSTNRKDGKKSFQFKIDVNKTVLQQYETPLFSSRREEDDAFIHDSINPTKLKRQPTPILELPKTDNEEGKKIYSITS